MYVKIIYNDNNSTNDRGISGTKQFQGFLYFT